ncbi:ABC transporter substrate-binding protein OS=Streptomyces cyaneofuscatus OX=66883 GN=G3I52_05985 PE=4 SV=1 [Streptomyces cyaneofuscatus]
MALALLLTGCGGGNGSASAGPKGAQSSAHADRVEPLAAAPLLPVTVDSADGTKVTVDPPTGSCR